MKIILPLKVIYVDEQGYHIFVKAKVNGKVANLLVDTGASKTVFDSNRISRFAEKGTMQQNEHLSTGLGTSSMQSHTILLKKLKIGELLIKNYRCFLLDLSHVNVTYEKLKYKPLDGVLGGDVLKEYNALIDYRKETLQLSAK